MQPPKLIIQKKRILDAKGHYRFYSIKNGDKRSGKITLGTQSQYNVHGEEYVAIPIKTEKQLVTFLAKNYGFGEFRIFAYKGGRNGLWTFWQGIVNEEGWMFKPKSSETPEVRDMRKEMENAETPQEAMEWEDLLNDAKQDARKETRKKKYGITPWLLPSGVRGRFMMWDEPDYAFMKKQEEESKPKKKYEEMSLDDINSM